MNVYRKNLRWATLLLPLLVAQQCSVNPIDSLPNPGAGNVCQVAYPIGSYVRSVNDATVGISPGVTSCYAAYPKDFYVEGYVNLTGYMRLSNLDMVHNVGFGGQGFCNGLPADTTTAVGAIAVTTSCGAAGRTTTSANANLMMFGRQQATWFFYVK